MFHIFAKVAGWLQFAGTAAHQVATSQPHGFSGWLGVGLSLLTALGIHFGASTDGAK